MTMQFEEVTDRLGAQVNYAGHPDDGKPLNVAIPSMGQMRIWQAVHGGPWDSFAKAEDACKRVWKQIRSAS